jgi:hypothetical protein
MTEAEKIDIEHRLTTVEDRSISNTKRLNEQDAKLKENSALIGAIKELAVETKYMREDLNETISRLDKLENKDGEKWDKFKWLIVAGLVTIVLGYLAISLGLK